MTATTISNTNELISELASIPEPKRAECIRLARAMLLGVRVSEQSRSVEQRKDA